MLPLDYTVSWMGRNGVGAEWSKEQNKQTVRDAGKDGPLLERRDDLLGLKCLAHEGRSPRWDRKGRWFPVKSPGI